MYHELASSKIDNQVVFPLEGLDLSQIVSGPENKSLLYDLYAIVCHFGGKSGNMQIALKCHFL